MSKKIIKRIIGRGFLEEAIELMLELVDKYGDRSDIENTLYNISGQFYQLDGERKKGVLSSEKYTINLNKLRGNLSELLDDDFREIEEEDIPESYKELLKAPAPTPVDEGGGDEPQNEAQEPGETTISSEVILFLSANPSKTALLKLKDEHSNIATELQDSSLRVKKEEAVSFSEFSKAVYSYEPKVVHFSGHGDLESPEVKEAYRVRGIGKPAGQQEVEEEEPGIILFDESKRNSHFVKASVLKELFSTAKVDLEIPLEAVIFNACHSEGQAKAVSEVGISVVGTSSSVADTAAIAFSTGFYFGLAEGKGIEKSFKLARVQAMAYGEPKSRFTLYVDGKKQEI